MSKKLKSAPAVVEAAAPSAELVKAAVDFKAAAAKLENTVAVNPPAAPSKMGMIDSLTKFTTRPNFQHVSKQLRDRITYTLKKNAESAKNVTVAVLSELMADARKELDALKATTSPTIAPVEASPKKLGKPAAKAAAAAPVAAPSAKSAKSAAPAAKPALAKKPAAPVAVKNEVKTAAPTTKAEFVAARMFPDEIELEEVGTLKKLSMADFPDFKSVREYLANDDAPMMYVVTYWTQRHLKQFDYAKNHMLPTAPKSFPHDLDVMAPISLCEQFDRLWAMSAYSEAVTNFDGESFTPVEDTDPATKEKYMVRVCNNMEFDLYALAE